MYRLEFIVLLLEEYYYFVFAFYWAGFTVAQRERAQEDFNVPYEVPDLTHPTFAYERQPQHRDHPTLFE